MLRRLFLALFVALIAPATASAGIASAITRDVPLGAARTLAAAAPSSFDLVGVKWKGAGTVELRVRGGDGRWGTWLPAAPEAEDAPDTGTSEARAAGGWRMGNPWWVGPSTAAQFRTTGAVSALRATYVRSPELRIPLRRPASAAGPAIVPRSGWAADESIRRAEPEYADSVRFAVVHHTAGANTYTQTQAAAIVRGIQIYHVQSNGWNDIGYNFLVDRFGIVYEGRYGGIEQNVVGAHAQGFNSGSVGVAVLGSYDGAAPSAAAEDAVARLLAWRLDRAHVDPGSVLSYISNGNNRFPAGIPVFLRAVSGHRDTGTTACPGDQLYARLTTLAQTTQAIGLPKLYEPLVDGQIGGPVRFVSRLSSPLQWTVRVRDGLGTEVSSGTGVGTTVDWTWDSTGALPGQYTWQIDAGPTVTPASGALTGVSVGDGTGVAGGAGVSFASAAADPETITPNGDGITDTTTIVYRLAANATVSADVLDPGGLPAAQLEAPRWRRAGEHTLTFDAAGLPDGIYAVQLTARAAGGAVATTSVTVAVTRTLGSLALGATTFSPNADGRLDTLGISFRLAGPATVTVRIMRGERWIATPFSGALPGGLQRVVWDGSKRVGRLRDGEYAAVVESVDAVATARLELPFLADTRAPLVKLLRGEPARLRVGEPARITMLVNGARRRLDVEEPGEIEIPGIRAVRKLSLAARDAAGNTAVLRV